MACWFKPCLARIAIGIEAPSSNHDDGVPEQFECGPKVLRQADDMESIVAWVSSLVCRRRNPPKYFCKEIKAVDYASLTHPTNYGVYS